MNASHHWENKGGVGGEITNSLKENINRKFKRADITLWIFFG
jgi:hypothetical protein